jgi:hypothetical protein
MHPYAREGSPQSDLLYTLKGVLALNFHDASWPQAYGINHARAD